MITVPLLQESAARETAPSGTGGLSWNFATKNLVGHEQLRRKIAQKVAKLERCLKHFPADALHLNIMLERQPRRHFHTSRLTLHVPSNILHAAKSAPDLVAAFDLSVKALLREIESLKMALRHETLWKRKERRAALRRSLKAAR